MPWICNYYVTMRCNAWCNFCNIPQTNNHAPPPEPTLEQFAENLRDLKRLGVRVLDLTGGEPTLYRHLVPAVTMAKEMGFYTTMTNNGMLYPKVAARLAGKIDSLVFSLESPDREENDRTRGVKCYDKVLESIRVAHSLGQTVYLGHVVTNEAMPKVGAMIAFARDLGVTLYLAPCYSFFGNEGLSAANATALMTHFNQPGVIIDRAQLKLVAAGGNHTSDPVCQAISSTVVISPDNKLILPCHHFRQEGLTIDGKLYDLYHSKAVGDAMAMEGRKEFCEGCTVYCYMRGSLFWKYPIDTLRMSVHYLHDRLRRKVLAASRPPPRPAPARVAPARAAQPPAAQAPAAKPHRSLPMAPSEPAE